MPILIKCPICASKFRAPDHAAGVTVPCSKCGGQIDVPGGKAKAKPTTSVDFSMVLETEKDARAQQTFVAPEVRVEDAEPEESRMGLWLALAGVAVLLILAVLTAMLLIHSDLWRQITG